MILTLTPGSIFAKAGGHTLRLSAMPIARYGDLLVPATEVAKAIGLRVSMRGKDIALATADSKRMMILCESPTKPSAEVGVVAPPPMLGTPR